MGAWLHDFDTSGWPSDTLTAADELGKLVAEHLPLQFSVQVREGDSWREVAALWGRPEGYYRHDETTISLLVEGSGYINIDFSKLQGLQAVQDDDPREIIMTLAFGTRRVVICWQV